MLSVLAFLREDKFAVPMNVSSMPSLFDTAICFPCLMEDSSQTRGANKRDACRAGLCRTPVGFIRKRQAPDEADTRFLASTPFFSLATIITALSPPSCVFAPRHLQLSSIACLYASDSKNKQKSISFHWPTNKKPRTTR